jgi:hypothetical protein
MREWRGKVRAVVMVADVEQGKVGGSCVTDSEEGRVEDEAEGGRKKVGEGAK